MRHGDERSPRPRMPRGPNFDSRNGSVRRRLTRTSGEQRMNYFPLTSTQQEWQERTADLAAHDIGPHAGECDRQSQYPQASLEALREAGLWALRIPPADGGLGGICLQPVWWSKRSPKNAPPRRCATRCTLKPQRWSTASRRRTRWSASSSRWPAVRCSPRWLAEKALASPARTGAPRRWTSRPSCVSTAVFI